MHKLYFGFALPSSMLVGDSMIIRQRLTPEKVKKLIFLSFDLGRFVSCCNSSHKPIIEVLKKFDIDIDIPTEPPTIKLERSDSMIVTTATGLPSLTDRHEYTQEEIDNATFEFVLYRMR